MRIDPEHVELVVAQIGPGPTEDSRLGPSILDNDDDSRDDWRR
jgi:hypothetical protein